ncbi:hypothetical protein BC826DRAFT_1052115 [Russula brevipes]|nr:hypothetical protein BC826DRAFT_1052115 [Russula brevipes]
MGTIYSIGAAWVVFSRIAKRRSRRTRTEMVPPNVERVLILGASSGVGRALANRYAQRGARVCVVARGNEALVAVGLKCKALRMMAGYARGRTSDLDGNSDPDSVLCHCADITRAEDLIAIREEIHEKWRGLDTMIVAAGVSALRPVLEIAGAEGPSVTEPSLGGVERVEDAALAAIKGNYLGPLLSVVTMIPLMRSTSPSPSVLLISSLGAVIPAPTRAIYGSSKAASYILYRSLAIENPSVDFSYVLPSTIEGRFRASAADPSQGGLKREVVARRCMRAIDAREKIVFVPAYYRYVELLSWIWPSYVERKAAEKYHFAPT